MRQMFGCLKELSIGENTENISKGFPRTIQNTFLTEVLLEVCELFKKTPLYFYKLKNSTPMPVKPDSVLKVIIADSCSFFRDGFHFALKKINCINKVTHVYNSAGVLPTLEKELHHVVFMDIEMSITDSIEATKKISRNYPEVKIIAVCMHDDTRGIAEMIHYGGVGCILKTTDRGEVERAIADVTAGKNYFSPNLSADIFQKLMAKQRRQTLMDNILTLREKEILGLICRQQTTGEISETLFISVKTVETHRGELLQKTKSKNVAGLVLWAIRNGYCEEL